MSDEKKKHIHFDVVVGNPPYQEEAHGEQKTFTPSIYNDFMDGSFDVSNKVMLITPARFLFDAGNTSHKWNQKMLSDTHFKVLQYFANSSSVFPNMRIKGGVAVSFRNATQDFGAIDTFVPFDELASTLHKVKSISKGSNITSIIFNQNKFDLDELKKTYPNDTRHNKQLESNVFSIYNIFTSYRKDDNQIKILGLEKNKRVFRYVDRKYIDLNNNNLFKYKVLVPQNNGSGTLGEILSTPLIGTPLIGYTRTFISFGAFSNQNEAKNCMKYIKTKFARALLDTLKVTQHNSRNTWRNVPLQDFTVSSDIDWNKSVYEIDQQLYKKYGLNQKEIDFIETHVKEMD